MNDVPLPVCLSCGGRTYWARVPTVEGADPWLWGKRKAVLLCSCQAKGQKPRVEENAMP